MTDRSMSVSDLEDRDIAAVREIYAHEVRHGLATFEEAAPDAAEMRQRWQAVRAAGLPYLVARQAGRVVGYAYASPYRPRPAYRYAVETSVYVCKEARGHGAGRAVMDGLITRLEAGPWRQAVAVIGDSGNLASIRLHTALGFERRGVMQAVGFKLGRWVDTVLMQRALGAGDRDLPK